MGFVIWYQVVFSAGGPGGVLPLVVSNDVFAGQYALDADITVDMVAGAVAGSFVIKLTDLPETVAATLVTVQHDRQLSDPVTVQISLGYFDDPASQVKPVLTGVIRSIRSSVDGTGHQVTEVSGLEIAGYRLLRKTVPADRKGPTQLDQFVKDLAGKAGVGATVRGLGSVTNLTVNATTAMQTLRQITHSVNAPVVVVDQAVRAGDAVGDGAGATFSAETNIVTLERHQIEVEAPPLTTADGSAGGPPGALQATAGAAGLPGHGSGDGVQTVLEISVLGDPSLRPGQPVTYQPRDPRNRIPGPLRLDTVRHAYNSSHGYTCAVRAVAAAAGKPGSQPVGAPGVAQRMRDVADNALADRPAIDMGEVESYASGSDGKHLASLHYGQTPAADVVEPSVEVDISRQPLLHDKPVIAPFAWHKCGLVVPLYPSMRAVLAHNRSLVNDALVAGFVWAEQPRHTPPHNLQGDWWLCLPTALGADGLPTGKGVNDLIDKSGRRVIQAEGLRITVGHGTLPAVGDRPPVPDNLASTLVIEHEANTKIAIDSGGAVTIETGGKDITISNGQASITLTGATIKLHGTSVEVS
jgi:hypothetical protein